jgi:hypothetical protein
MPTFVGRYSDHAYAVTRVVVGLLFACHGAQKLFGVLGGIRELGGEGLLAGIIEFFGGSLVALGLVASWLSPTSGLTPPLDSGPSKTVESGPCSIASFSSMWLQRVPDVSLLILFFAGAEHGFDHSEVS